MADLTTFEQQMEEAQGLLDAFLGPRPEAPPTPTEELPQEEATQETPEETTAVTEPEAVVENALHEEPAAAPPNATPIQYLGYVENQQRIIHDAEYLSQIPNVIAVRVWDVQQVRPSLRSGTWDPTTDRCFEIETGEIRVPFQNQIYNFGRYKVRWLAKTTNHPILPDIHPIDPLMVDTFRGACCHPHILSSGELVCWSDYSAVIRRALTQRDYRTVGDLLMMFLTSYNTAHQFAHIGLFQPEAPA